MYINMERDRIEKGRGRYLNSLEKEICSLLKVVSGIHGLFIKFKRFSKCLALRNIQDKILRGGDERRL